jgi:hypothetical protein
MKPLYLVVVLPIVIFISGCAVVPYDYTNYNKYPPRSILVLPPMNDSIDVGGTYGYFSTCTMPIAEQGYYVFPISVIDGFFKENGMPSAAEMHQAPLEKIGEIFGADAVLYITLNEYGSSYQVITSQTKVSATAELIDVKTRTLLWNGTLFAEQSSGDGGGGPLGALVTAAVTQVLNQSTDQAHLVSRLANQQFRESNTGLLPGPYLPQEE